MQATVKDVQERLLTVRTCHRKEGAIPYPLHYSKELQNYDNWNRLFMSQYVKNGLTLHEFKRPPSKVLDLGCSAGSWILEAAAYWKDCHFVGFDLPALKDLQPKDLQKIPNYEKTAPRVRWSYGNLLEGLPFPSEEFDFVRVVGIGLGVPEDEWQYVLEEIGRVLKFGGVVEIIEDDLIFPCYPKPQEAVHHVRFPTASSPPSAISLHSTNTMLSFPQSLEEHSAGKVPFPRKDSGSVVQTRPRKGSSSSMLSQPDYDEGGPDSDRQNHEKLKTAFESMLAARFLSPRTLSILPFYLQSIFDDIWSYPALHIPLPPNSKPSDIPDFDWETRFNATTAFALSSASKVSNDDFVPKPSEKDKYLVSLWSPMHLARTVETIKACKEAIWIEYELLYGNEAELPLVTRTTRPKDIRPFTSRASAREQFDRVWWNWENDMTDRMRLRSIMEKECKIPEPLGDKPDWQIWRKRVAAHDYQDNRPPQEAICRSVRGFVGFKRTH